MQIELRPISAITPYPGNPRINDDAVESVAKSLKEYGFRQPIVVDAAGLIIVGHTRLKAAQKLGLTHVPVHVATDPSAEQVRAYGGLIEARKREKAPGFQTWGLVGKSWMLLVGGEVLGVESLVRDFQIRRGTYRPDVDGGSGHQRL